MTIVALMFRLLPKLAIILWFTLTVIGAETFLYAFSMPFFEARSGKEKDQNKRRRSQSVWTTKTKDYFIFFSLLGGKARPKARSEAKKMRELSYKWVSWDENPKHFFEGGKWAEIRFLDAEGFLLARDSFTLSDLTPQQERYGFAVIEAEKVPYLSRAEVVWRSASYRTETERAAEKAPSPNVLPAKENAEPSAQVPRKAEETSKSEGAPPGGSQRVTNEDVIQILEKMGQKPSAGGNEGNENENDSSEDLEVTP